METFLRLKIYNILWRIILGKYYLLFNNYPPPPPQSFDENMILC